MAFSRSRETVLNRRHLLTKLEMMEECEWVVPAGQEVYYANQIREALYAAHANKELFPALAEAYQTFEIKRPRNKSCLVIAQRKRQVDPEQVRLAGLSDVNRPEILFDPFPKLDGQQSFESVVEGWNSRQPIDQLEFRGAKLSNEDLLLLYQWCQNLELMMFVSPTGDLRVRTFDPELVMVAWDPSEIEES